MRVAPFVALAFSTGGLMIVLLALAIGLMLRPRSWLVRAAMLAAIVWYFVISIYPVPRYVGALWSAPFAPLTKSDVPAGRTAIALLGSGAFTAVDWKRGRAAIPDPIGLSRTLEAARVYQLIEPEWVISSGGLVNPRSPDISPGVAMQETLVRLGVPASRIIVKDEALDTHDEALNVMGLVSSLGLQHVVLVTSGIHMRRALATFRATGVPAIPAPAREDPPGRFALWRNRYLPTQVGLYESSLVAHELVGFVYYGYRGWR
jgi:uncharacterized SAM-binding protein YcdF (DUF218 family)